MDEVRKNRNYFTRALSENQNIDERFRNLMHDTFDGIYSAMGKKNFLRWINQKNIADRIKKLVVEEFTKEDIKKYPMAAGFYTHGTNREKIRGEYINKSTATHETYHFFTDWYFTGVTFPIFINEGLTEYLNRETEKINEKGKNVSYAYCNNVDFVEILHNTIGDSLIKAYLTGNSKKFSEEFSTYITEDGSVNVEALKEFYKLLTNVHDIFYPSKYPKTDEEKEKIEANKKDMIENIYPKLRHITENIVSNAIRKKAHDLEYYEEGILNIEYAIEDINELVKKTIKLLEKNRTFVVKSFSSKENFEMESGIFRKALTAVLEESHIPNDKIEDIVNATVFNGSITRIGDENSISYSGIITKKLLDKINSLGNQNVIRNLIEKRLGNKQAYMTNKEFNVTNFLMDISLILDKMNVEKDLKPFLLDAVLFRYVPKDINRDFLKTMIDKYDKLYVALYQKQQDNKRNVIESKFVKIGNNKFIEKRDNKFYLLEYDEKTGMFLEGELNNEYSYQIERFSKEEIDEFGGSINRRDYKVEKLGEKTQLYTIKFNNDFSKVKVNSKLCDVIPSIEKLGDEFLIDEIMKPILEGIKNNKYISILNDEEAPLKDTYYTWIVPDKRSRVINYSLFLKELRDIDNCVPAELRKNIEKAAINSLITRTYSITPEYMNEIQDYMINLSLNNITKDSVADKLYAVTERLNQDRRSYVEQESKCTGLYFRTEDAEKRYFENEKIKEKKQKILECIQDAKTFVGIESIECIEKALELETDENYYNTIEGVTYRKNQIEYYRTAIAEKVDYNAFCDKLKDALLNIEDNLKDKFKKYVVEESISMWYGEAYGYPGEDEILDKRYELEKELKEILNRRIDSNSELDIERIAEIEEQFLELSKQEQTICRGVLEKRNPIVFENENVRKNYEIIKNIYENEEIPDESKAKIIKHLKDRNKTEVQKKRSMDAFARLALEGISKDGITEKDIIEATKSINFYDIEK